jgi:hypothetical protein
MSPEILPFGTGRASFLHGMVTTEVSLFCVNPAAYKQDALYRETQRIAQNRRAHLQRLWQGRVRGCYASPFGSWVEAVSELGCCRPVSREKAATASRTVG